MFHEIAMKRLVVVQPKELTADNLGSRRNMVRRLLSDIDTLKCSEEDGYYVAVTTLESVSEGRIRPGTGCVVYWVEFKCLVFMPHKNEIVEAEVTKVNDYGFFADCGPLAQILVAKREMAGFEFRKAEVETYNSYKDESGSEIVVNAVVRLRIIGIKWMAEDRKFIAVGSLNGDLLGHLPDFGKNPPSI